MPILCDPARHGVVTGPPASGPAVLEDTELPVDRSHWAAAEPHRSMEAEPPGQLSDAGKGLERRPEAGFRLRTIV